MERFYYFFLFICLGWIPILAIKALICGIIDSTEKNKCYHELEYEEARILNEIGDSSTNISVSMTCKKCGYHKSYLKFKH